jgi:uncharacterized protein
MPDRQPSLLSVLSIRLPWAYPGVLAIVDVALVLLIIGNQTSSTAANQAAGWLVFAFVAVVGFLRRCAVGGPRRQGITP